MNNKKLYKSLLVLVTFLLAPHVGAKIEIVPGVRGETTPAIEIVQPEPSQPQTTSPNTVQGNVQATPEGYKTTNTEPHGADRAMLILDASGSMWGKIAEQTKIGIARNVIGEVLKDWQPATELGLMSYGHRSKGDCDDIETLIEPTTLSLQHFSKTVAKLTPKGKTPLTQAVLNAAEKLKYVENKATVILISDGEETCGMDPCATGQSLEELGIDFTAHVISFDVPAAQSAGMRCLAQATGGRFIEAADYQELSSALSNVVATANDTEPVLTSAATLQAPAQVVAGSEFSVTWTGPQNRSDRLRIRTPQGERTKGHTYVGDPDSASPASMRAPEKVGPYIIHYETRTKQSLGSTEIMVIAAVASVSLPAQVIAGSAVDVTWTGPKNRLDKLLVIDEQGKQSYAYNYIYLNKDKSPAAVNVPEQVGHYRMVYRTHGGNNLAEASFEVIEANASVAVPDTVVAGSTFDVDWTGPKNKLDRLMVFSPDRKQKFKYTYVHRRKVVSPTELRAPEEPGEYVVHYFTHGEQSLASAKLTVAPALATVAVPTSVVAGGQLDIEWTGPKNPYDKLIIYSADGKLDYRSQYVFRKGARSPEEIQAPEVPGTYELRYFTQGERTLAAATFEVTAAQATVSVGKDPLAGQRFNVHWTGPANNGDRLQIFSEDSEQKFKRHILPRRDPRSPVKLQAPIEPGVYSLHYRTRGERSLSSTTFRVLQAPSTDNAQSNGP